MSALCWFGGCGERAPGVLLAATAPFSDTWLGSLTIYVLHCYNNPGYSWWHEKTPYPSGRRVQSIRSQQSPLGQAASRIFFSVLNCTLKKTKGEVTITLTVCLVFIRRKSAAASAFVFLYPCLSDETIGFTG